MKLAEKGRYSPPPVLPEHAQVVSDTLAGWPDVQARTHWLLGDENEVDGADFYVGTEELGHLHLDGEAHVALSKRLRDALVAKKLAKPFVWSPAFVVRRARRASDVAPVTFLFRLAYDHLCGTAERDLLERIARSPAP